VYVALVPLLPLYAERFALSTGDVGLLYGAYPLLAFASAVPAGALADRFGAQATLVGGLALFVGASIGFALAASVWTLMLARSLQGFAGGISGTVGMAAIASAVAPERRAETLGGATAIQGLSSLLGPPLAAAAATTIGLGVAYAVPAALGAWLLAAIVRRPPLERRTRGRFGAIGIRARLADPDVRASVSCILAIGVAGGAVQTLAPLQLESAGVTAAEVGLLFALASALSVVTAPLVGRAADRGGVRAATVAWAGATVGLLVALGISAPTWVGAALVVMFLPQIRIGATLAYARGAGAAQTGARFATSYGFAIAAWAVGASAGPIAAGYVAQAVSRTAAYAVAAALTAALALPAVRAKSRR
jgi:MFS transporter, DHA1 family, solute carrier family 18 (vesicular amine transporter), member 1/2